MPLTLPGSMPLAVQQNLTDPNYLVQLGFSPIIRRANKSPVTYLSNNYSVDGTYVHAVTPADATLSLPNYDASNTALALNNQLPDITCDIFLAYDGDVLKVFSGVLDSAEIGPRIFFTARRGSRAKNAPNTYITPPTFNHIAPRGLELRWGADTLVLN